MVVSAQKVPSPLDHLLLQIDAASQNGLHLVAISMAVALPDICVSLASEDGRSDRRRYKDWCAENLTGDAFSYISGDDLYSIRCGVLHNGRFGDLKHNVERVVFALPGGISITNCVINDAYVYTVSEFCRNLCRAAARWYEAHKDEQNVKANLPRMMSYHPDGLTPYTQGIPVIA